jgi:serpin B
MFPPAMPPRAAESAPIVRVQQQQTMPMAMDTVSIQFGAKKARITQAKVNEGVNAASTEFATKMLAKMANTATTSNKVFSPANTFLLTAMLQAGAQGETAQELQALTGTAKLVKAGASKDQLVIGVQNYVAEFAQLMEETGITLNQSFGIWARSGEQWKPSFTQRMDVLGAEAGTLSSAANINNWAAAKTNNKIKNIVSDAEVRNASAVLASATYLLSNWRKQFKEANTRPAPFHGLQGDTTVKMMNGKFKLPTASTPLFDSVRLAYGTESESGKELSMSLFLPKEGQDLKAVYTELFANGKIAQQLNALQDARSEDVRLSLPKHVLESETNTKEVLEQLGVDRMFGRGANFSDMMDGVFVSAMKQKAYIDVNEKGTEAAAVDVAVMTRSAFRPPVEKIMTFDKPFLSVIHDDQGRILFVSTVTDLPDAK